MSAVTPTGRLIHYEKLGRGRPVILLHGWIGSWRYWIPLMRQLQLKYVVYAVDLYGYGDSTHAESHYTVAKQVELLYDFMSSLGLKKAAIVGHGLGAMVAAHFAREYPERVARLMLVSAPLFDVPDLANRRQIDQPRPLTPSNASNPFPGVDGLDDADFEEDATRLRRDGSMDARIGSMRAAGAPADVTVPSASQETMVRPGNIDQNELRRMAMQQGIPLMQGDDSLGSSAQVNADQSRNNPLSRALNGDSASILARCFKRSESEYDKLMADVTKMDDRAMHYSAEYFDPGVMLDVLRQIQTMQVIVHGEDDEIIPKPPAAVWNFLKLNKDKLVADFTLPGVRHFPMLEYEPFTRMVTSFLETSDVTALDQKERWRRRTR